MSRQISQFFTDARDNCIGTILAQQEDDSVEHVIQYISFNTVYFSYTDTHPMPVFNYQKRALCTNLLTSK